LPTMLIGSNPKNNEDPSCPTSGGNYEFEFWSWCFHHVEIPKVSENLWLLGMRILDKFSTQRQTKY
jgi:hypothetical protein